MRTSIFFLAVALYGAEKTYPTSCERVWPATIQELIETGFSPKVSDRQSGLLSFTWNKGADFSRFGNRNATVKSYTVAYAGFWAQWEAFKIESADAVFVNSDQGCAVTLKIVFQGMKKPFMGQRQWFVLPSNDRAEAGLLDRLGTRVRSGPIEAGIA